MLAGWTKVKADRVCKSRMYQHAVLFSKQPVTWRPTWRFDPRRIELIYIAWSYKFKSWNSQTLGWCSDFLVWRWRFHIFIPFWMRHLEIGLEKRRTVETKHKKHKKTSASINKDQPHMENTWKIQKEPKKTLYKKTPKHTAGSGRLAEKVLEALA